MGCYSSSLDDGRSPRGGGGARPRMVPTGGGSMIMAGPSAASRAGTDDDALLPTKGGSYIIGRKRVGDWEPGAPIARPDNSMRAAHFYMAADPSQRSSSGPGSGEVLRVSHSVISVQGRSPHPPSKPNQDSHLILHRLGNVDNLVLFGAFDGHGPRGEDASQFSRINLPDVAVSRPIFDAAPLDAIAGSFEALHRRFIAPT